MPSYGKKTKNNFLDQALAEVTCIKSKKMSERGVEHCELEKEVYEYRNIGLEKG